MPGDVPILPDVQIHHLLKVYLMQALLQHRVLDEAGHLRDRHVVHECPCIDRVVDTILDVRAWLPSAHQTSILNVVCHQAPIVNNFSQAAREEDIIVQFGRVSSETFGECQAQARPPTFPAAVYQIIYGFDKALVDGVAIGFLELVLEMLGEEVGESLFQVGLVDVARQYPLHNLRLVKEFAVVVQEFRHRLLRSVGLLWCRCGECSFK